MSYEKQFDDFMPHTVTVDPWTATGAYGNHTNSTGSRRPDFIVPADPAPIEPLAEDCLLAP